MSIEFVDLQAQRGGLGGRIEAAIDRVLAHGRFVMGPEIEELESELASRAGVPEVVTCSSGTDALVLALMALGIGPGDAVLCPAFTFAATAESICLVGATPVFMDVRRDTFNLDPEQIVDAVEVGRRAGLRPRGIIPVDLFGQPAEYDRIVEVATANGLQVVADGAQSFGGSWDDRPVGSLAPVTTTSFFPAKPLGCYGDGGAIMVRDADTAALLRSLRVHGQGQDKYDNVRVGMNGRLDSIQAAILLVKLRVFDEELTSRQRIADRYTVELGDVLEPPMVLEPARSAWAQYTVVVPERDRIAKTLRANGIPTAVYYPTPLHALTAYADCPRVNETLPVAEELATEVLSLPVHPYLTSEQQAHVIGSLRAAIAVTAG